MTLTPEILESMRDKMMYPATRMPKGRLPCWKCGSNDLWTKRVLVNPNLLNGCNHLGLNRRRAFDSMRSRWVKQLMPDVQTELIQSPEGAFMRIFCASCNSTQNIRNQMAECIKNWIYTP